MKTRRTTLLTVILLLVIIVIGLVLVLARGSHAPAAEHTTTVQNAVNAADYTFVVPANWAKLSSQNLASETAANGIARTDNSTTKFLLAVEPAASSPKTMDELKATTVLGLQRLTNYSLVSEKTTTVSKTPAEQFIYTFGGNAKTEQQLLVSLHNGQVFSLLFTASQQDFGPEAADFQRILSSFTFK
jgi:hypothetical protein